MLQTDKGTHAEITPAATHKKTSDLPSTFAVAVTIDRPAQELYAFWADFSNLPRFMENVLAVTPAAGGRTHWVVQGPNGDVEWGSVLTEDRPGQLLAWKSVEDSDVENEGRILFKPAPGARGTEVHALISFKPPMGTLGRMFAAMKERDPHMQVRRDLRRFKQLMETGEVSTAIGRTVPPPKS